MRALIIYFNFLKPIQSAAGLETLKPAASGVPITTLPYTVTTFKYGHCAETL